MNIVDTNLEEYLLHCRCEKRLDTKTLRAYRCDLEQLAKWLGKKPRFDRELARAYLAHLNSRFAPSTAKRKVASAKAFFSWCEGEGAVGESPFRRLKVSIREPRRLPRTIPRADLRALVATLETETDADRGAQAASPERLTRLRNAAIAEVLIATGIRISELCGLDRDDYDRTRKTLRVMGKGSKERVIQIGCTETQRAIERYIDAAEKAMGGSGGALFLNRFGTRLSARAARSAVTDICCRAGVRAHVTPHMFRHTFATMLLEQDVDIRYIQQILGHSSLRTTEIYTHVTSRKLEEILTTKNPRTHA